MLSRRAPRITFDFETRSACDLKKCGAYKYSLDPTTQPTCLGYLKPGHPKADLLTFEQINSHWEDLPHQFREFWENAIETKCLFVAHNAFFERCIYENILVRRYGWPHIPFRLYRCTAAKAAACALPRSLEGAGEALNLSVQKDRSGYIAMMKTCKPTRAWKTWEDTRKRYAAGSRLSEKKLKILYSPAPKMFCDPNEDPYTWSVLYRYCKIDVEAESALDRALPDLIPIEQEIWNLNQKMNWRGLRIDISTVEKITEILHAESKKRVKELDTLTMGLVTKPGARQSILDFLEIEGVKLPDIRAKTVQDALHGEKMSTAARRLLELRKALSLASTKKYEAFLNRAASDERVRDILLYHGASTGRDSGTGIQPQNFPRGLIKVSKGKPYSAVENVISEDTEMLKLLYGDNLSVLFSAVLRNMIIPSEGHQLFVADFSKIEVAVLWWLADNAPGLKVLRSGRDPYKYMAAANTGKSYDEISDEERQLGKAQVLGCGFGMGHVKFRQTAWEQYRLKLSEEQSQAAVFKYRRANAAVPVLWKAYEKAAIAAVSTKKPQKAGKCLFFVQDKFLWVELPSGRRLAYRQPHLANIETDYGPRLSLQFFGVDSSKKKMRLERTWGGTLTENIVQATARELMAHGLLRLEKAGYRALLTVHDEVICEKQEGSTQEFSRILCEVPKWGPGLPIEAAAWTGPRYRK